MPNTTKRRSSNPAFAQYMAEAQLYRLDPMLYAMAVLRQTYERSLDAYERSLSSIARLERDVVEVVSRSRKSR